jgi:hypothetical protein
MRMLSLVIRAVLAMPLGALADAAGFCHGDEVTQALASHHPYDPDMGKL